MIIEVVEMFGKIDFQKKKKKGKNAENFSNRGQLLRVINVTGSSKDLATF